MRDSPRPPRRPWVRRALIAIAVAYVAALVGVPLLTLIRGAFGDGIGLFLSRISTPHARHALWLTVELAAFAVGVHAIFGTIVAWVLVRDRFYGKRILAAFVDVPFAVPPVVAGFVLIEIFGPKGWLRPWADALGVKVAFALPGMAIATAFVSLPFVVREIAPVLEEVGTDQEEAAHTLGASSWTTFWKVTLPSIRWGLASGITLTASRAIGEFGAVLVVSGGVAGQTETATAYVYRALEDRNEGAAHAVALTLSFFSVALLLAMEALKRRRARAITAIEAIDAAEAPAVARPEKVTPWA